MTTSEKYIRRCFELALNGLGNVAPNPLVGCVIVNNGNIIGEGFHQKYGDSHAEVNAINSVVDKSLLKESELYVNLEPCCHYGKTPPCTELIIKSKIPKVFISNVDPFYKVNCSGITTLKANGVEVITDVLKEEGVDLNKRFFTFHNHKRPYIILKWAQSIDGFIDKERCNSNYKPIWITNENLKTLVHKWRTEEQAIMIGKKTALLDNPFLTARLYYGNNPVRLIIDPEANLDFGLNIFNSDAKTLIFNNVISLEKNNLQYIKLDFHKNINNQICDYLYNIDIQSVIIEGGSFLLNSFIDNNIWDEARIFIGNKYFGNGVIAPHIKEDAENIYSYNEDKLIIIKNKCISNDN